MSVFLPTYNATDHSEGVTLAADWTACCGTHEVPKYLGDLLTSEVYTFWCM